MIFRKEGASPLKPPPYILCKNITWSSPIKITVARPDGAVLLEYRVVHEARAAHALLVSGVKKTEHDCDFIFAQYQCL